MNYLIEAVCAAFFAWFFEFAIYNVPYLRWYGRFLDKLPDHFSDPLGKCPYCFTPWLILILFYVPIPTEIKTTIYAFGIAYGANSFFGKYFQ